MEPSGLSAEELFVRGQGITYTDFTILDTQYTEISKKEISLETEIGKGIMLQTPIIASPMDTVTNPELCTAIALEGGIGAIHYNHKDATGTPDVDQQIKEIERVKRWQNGFIEKPVTVSPDTTIAAAMHIGEQFKVGKKKIDTFPVTEDGSTNGKFLGLLRKQDYSRTQHTSLKVRERMIPIEKLVTASIPMKLEEAEEILWQEHIPSLPVLDKTGNLTYLVTRADIDKREEFPLATTDEGGRLRVLFAVDTWPEAYERMERGFAAGADGVIIDTSQGYSVFELDILKHAVAKYPGKLVIGGNISTKEAVDFLHTHSADAYRNGQGTGSICTTAGAIGISRAGATGVYEGSLAVRKRHIKTIADGGLRKVGDIFKALAIGAHAGMLGNMLAGTEESPGDVEIDPETGMSVKVYRGMGSAEANVGGQRGYGKLPQGVAGRVQYKGSIHTWVPLIRDGLISAFQVRNCRNMKELHRNLYEGNLRFERRSIGSILESQVHGLQGFK